MATRWLDSGGIASRTAVKRRSRLGATTYDLAGLLGAGEQDPRFESEQLQDSCRVACFRGATSVFKWFSGRWLSCQIVQHY